MCPNPVITDNPNLAFLTSQAYDIADCSGEVRKRRDVTDVRYSSTDAIGSINGVTGGLKKWAIRYIGACGGQKKYKHIEKHAMKWRRKLTTKLNDCGNF